MEPLDDLDQHAWNADLLDWLADDLTTNKHDLKHTLRLICTSRAYQLPSREAEGAFVFRGPVPNACSPSNSSTPSPPSAANGKTAGPSSVWTAANKAAKSAR